MKREDAGRPGTLWFWLLAGLLAALLFAASAPSPLYGIYQAMWGFSPLTLTAIYGIYALGALAGLLVTGRVSDHVGRRLVTSVGLAIQVVGMLAFVFASGVEWLYGGRLIQGLGTGIATGAISAWLLDLEPRDGRGLGGLIGGLAPVAGLALGAFGSGLLAEYGPDPLHLVFWVLIAVFVSGLGAMPFVPDVVVPMPGWRAALRPRIGVPQSARGPFAASTPSLVAVWAIAGLYLSLGPTLALTLLGSDDRVAGGLVVTALLGTSTVSAFLLRRADPRTMVVRGSVGLIAGVAISLAAVAIGSPALLYGGSIVAGIGFGPAWSGIFRSIAALAPPDRRGELVASILIVLYLSFSVPAIIGGLAVTLLDLRSVTYGYGVVVIGLAMVTAVAVWRRTASAQKAT